MDEKERWILEELWMEIKSYLFHDILKHGKHLREDMINKKYNEVMQKMPCLDKLSFPQFFLNSVTSPFRTMTCVYALNGFEDRVTTNRRRYLLVCECQALKENIGSKELFDVFSEGITYKGEEEDHEDHSLL